MRYRLLGRSGLRVSEVCLGTMTFGTDWGWGADAGASRKQFELFAEAGGNFVDTANKYTDGTAEQFLGELIAGDRDRYVVATKYGLSMRDDDSNASGNHRKNLVRSLDASLRRLGTDYVDVYWLHAWDYTTPIDEVVRALDDQVQAGKILHVGISDTPAWIIARGQTIAELRGWAPFVGVQVEYSLAQREAERELLPMARGLGLSVMAWAPLAGGVLSGKYGRGADADARRLGGVPPERLRIAEAVGDVADELGLPSSQVALAWLLAQPDVIPILGARTPQQLADNLSCLDATLPDEQLERLDAITRPQLGFPHDFLVSMDDVVYGPGGRERIVNLPAR